MSVPPPSGCSAIGSQADASAVSPTPPPAPPGEVSNAPRTNTSEASGAHTRKAAQVDMSSAPSRRCPCHRWHASRATDPGRETPSRSRKTVGCCLSRKTLPDGCFAKQSGLPRLGEYSNVGRESGKGKTTLHGICGIRSTWLQAPSFPVLAPACTAVRFGLLLSTLSRLTHILMQFLGGSLDQALEKKNLPAKVGGSSL